MPAMKDISITAGRAMYNCCPDYLDLTRKEAAQKQVLKIVLAVNLTTFVLMVGGAYLSQSTALLSGTLDNLGDALTYALSLMVVGASTSAKAKVAFFKGILILSRLIC